MGWNDSKPQQTTTTSEPPAYLKPYLEHAATNAATLYNRGGTTLPGMSSQTQTALDMAQLRAMSGSPVTQAAQDYAVKGLSGGFMGANPFLQGGANPYLDATFNQAAQATRNQLSSEYARAGRSISDSEGIRGEQLNSLATNIYGGAYETDANRRLAAYQGERQLQQGLVPVAPGLAAADYNDITQLANVGATHEGYEADMRAQAGRALDEYLARLHGFQGGTVTQTTPTQRNWLAGAAGGASAGSLLGPWGMLGGAILGGLYG